MFNIYSQLPAGRKDVEKHIEALSKMTRDKDHRALFDHLYDCLSILDGKSASLLSFNSIIIAVFAIFMTTTLSNFEFIIANIGIILVLVSSILLLVVVWIHWSTTKDFDDLKLHAITLLYVRRTRTIKYRFSWYFSICSIGSLVLFIIVRFVARI